MTLERFKKKDYKKLMGADDCETNQNHIILEFVDFDFTPDLITDKLELQPQSTGQKGDKYFIGNKNKISKIRECNHWNYEMKVNSNEFIGEIIDKFFKEIIIPRLDLIKQFGQNCEIVRLTIVQYYYTGNNPGYVFEKEQIKILAAINAEVDMDIYCLCEEE